MPYSQDKLKRASTTTNWGDPPPAGDYTAELTGSSAFTSQKGEDWVKFTFKIVDGALTGHEWDVIHSLEDTPRLAFTAKELAAIGVNIDSAATLSELAALVAGREGRRYDLTVVINGRFTNTNVKAENTQTQIPIQNGGRVAPDVPVDRTDFQRPAPVDDDDIPF